MTPEPACCSLKDTIEKAATLMSENDCGCIPVIDERDGGRIVGVVTDRDIAVRAVARGRLPDTAVQEVMSEGIQSCSADTSLAEVERAMTEHQIRRILVLDRDGCCSGIISQADLARAQQSSAVSADDVALVIERISEARHPRSPAARAEKPGAPRRNEAFPPS
ncbi:MAG TPA: CBS domain-containing protein [Gemmatimonadaceae bacterium]